MSIGWCLPGKGAPSVTTSRLPARPPSMSTEVVKAGALLCSSPENLAGPGRDFPNKQLQSGHGGSPVGMQSRLTAGNHGSRGVTSGKLVIRLSRRPSTVVGRSLGVPRDETRTFVSAWRTERISNSMAPTVWLVHLRLCG
ncbi:hypothetical protein BDP81DRAFT_56490 [Colletotrichum phormii]|uniref:Uncharacterized protein n=1 Tax=Colletotrichum phormii TaxID=359342 RepID=A0AAI9ZLP8_9PEZI|nr:uncharacterized protein BDP81DRAFT_56490 [Colletotrichum phormii]KAK1634273.1 hypothetical protein BDP81DRAFT_56490 [Colletotrichum phormii]